MGLGLACFECLKSEMSVPPGRERAAVNAIPQGASQVFAHPWERCLLPQACERGERGQKATAEEGQHGCRFVKAKAPVP